MGHDGIQYKAPGADEITAMLLRAAWPSVGGSVRALYEGSLRYKNYRTTFKLAEVVLIPRHERDPSRANGWRLIPLLSCLGRRLERLIAKRVACTVLNNYAVPHNLSGASCEVYTLFLDLPLRDIVLFTVIRYLSLCPTVFCCQRRR